MSMHNYIPPNFIYGLICGICGAVVSAMTPWRGPWEAGRKIIVGGLSAAFFTPVFTPLVGGVLKPMGAPEDSAAGIAGFVCGLCGLLLAELIVTTFRERFGDWLNRVLGPTDGGDNA